MKKNTKIMLIIVGIIFLIIITKLAINGVSALERPSTEEKQNATKEEQIAFLKKNEEEITEYIKTKSSKIDSVQLNWDSVNTERIGNGTPMGAGELLMLKGKFNDIEDSNFILSFGLDDDNIPKLDTIELLDSLYVGGTIYE